MSDSPPESRSRRSAPRDGPAAPVADVAVPMAPERVPVASVALQGGAWARHIDALATIACLYLALITIGFAAFRFLPQLQPTGASRNPDRTFFAAANAVTLTGFTQNSATAAMFPLAGQAAVAGLAVASALLALVAGGWFLRSILGLRDVGLLKIIAISVALVAWPLVAVHAVGAFDPLSAGTGFGWTTTPMLSAGSMTAWRWLALAASVPATLGPLPIAWLLGFVPSQRTDRSGAASPGSILFAAAIAYLVVLLAFGACMSGNWSLASFEAINTRGLGLGGVAIATLPAAVPWLMILAMCVGVAPGATAGGLSLLPLILLARAAWRGRSGTLRLDATAGIAVAWAGAFVGLLALLIVLFAATGQPMPGDRQLFLITSAFCNVGLSFDPLGVTGSGLVVISAAMIVGRVLPMLMLCWMAAVVDAGAISDEAASD